MIDFFSIKVGIVGCSQNEKYLLTSAVFRLNKTEGLLKVDDVDIKKIYLHHLRQKMSIIPEVRTNDYYFN